MGSYKVERSTFRRLKAKLEADVPLRREVERALEVLLYEYNTTVHENRFVVGGACERILGAAMRASGIDAENVGTHNPRIDLGIPGAQGFSVKGSFTGKRDDIRLINSLGKSETRKWSEATIFILANTGIGYADPELLKNATKSMGDALILKRRHLDRLFQENPECLIRCAVASKSTQVKKTKVASEAVAKEILGRAEFPKLGRFAR